MDPWMGSGGQRVTDDPTTKSMSQGDDDASLPPAGSQDPNLGRRIGRFHIKSAIASGGMGTVYLAVQDWSGRPATARSRWTRSPDD